VRHGWGRYGLKPGCINGEVISAPFLTHVGLAGADHEVYVYNALGLLTGVSHTLGNAGKTFTSAYEYDGAGRLTRIVDPHGLVTTFTRDGLGRRTSRTDLRGKVTWVYDDMAGRVTRTEADGSTVIMTV